MSARPTIRRLLLAVLATLTLAGCSQAAALAPVGGNRLTIIRFAAYDILVQNHVDVLSAPVCTLTGRNVSCAGTTLAGEAIKVTSSADDQSNMDVFVGAKRLFHGAVQGVLDSAARPRP